MSQSVFQIWIHRIHMFLGLPDPFVREVWIRILLSSCKKVLDSYYFVTFFDFLSLENYVNVPSNSNKQKKYLNKNCFLIASLRSMTKKAGSGSGSICQRHGSLDPDPLQNVMDPEHWLQFYFASIQSAQLLYEKREGSGPPSQIHTSN